MCDCTKISTLNKFNRKNKSFNSFITNKYRYIGTYRRRAGTFQPGDAIRKNRSSFF